MMELRIHFGSLDSETHILLQPLEDATWKSIQNCRCLGKTLGSARFLKEFGALCLLNYSRKTALSFRILWAANNRKPNAHWLK